MSWVEGTAGYLATRIPPVSSYSPLLPTLQTSLPAPSISIMAGPPLTFLRLTQHPSGGIVPFLPRESAPLPWSLPRLLLPPPRTPVALQTCLTPLTLQSLTHLYLETVTLFLPPVRVPGVVLYTPWLGSECELMPALP